MDTMERKMMLEASEEAKSGIKYKLLPLELISSNDLNLLIQDSFSDKSSRSVGRS